MRRRAMRRGPRERSGNWRADYLETRTVGSPGARREKGCKSSTSPAAYPTWHIRSKKDGLGLLDHSYPLTRNPIEGQGNRFFSLDGERSSFDGFWAYDDDPLGRIDSLMKGRLRSLLFKPPFDTHGADRLRSE